MGCCLSIDDRANKNAYFSDYNDPTISPVSPVNGGSESSEPIMLRDNPNFTCSTNGRNGWLIHEVYDFGELCGRGQFGEVYGATHKRGASSEKYAIKKTSPTALDRRGGVWIRTYDHVEDKCQEIKSLLKLRGSNSHDSCVLHMYEYYWTYNNCNVNGTLHIVTEFLGQELEVWRRRQPRLLESTVKEISSVILNALNFISTRNIIHRDIKLSNILFRVDGDVQTLKLVDFGLAKNIEDSEEARGFCGTLGYIAPEIYEEKAYRFEVDMFAFGVILFRLLSGVRPFSLTNESKLANDTVNLRYKVEGRRWEGISSNALNLVRNLLIGQHQRLTAQQAIDHEWFNDNSMADTILIPDVTISHDNQNNDENHSRKIVLSHVPQELLPRSNGNTFYLDASIQLAVQALIWDHKYVGTIITNENGDSNDFIYVEEKSVDTASSLSEYIVRLPSYTEMHARMIFRQIVQIIKLCHDNGLAHRNLLFSSFLIDSRFDDNNNIILRGLQYSQAIKQGQPLTGHFGYIYDWYAYKAPEIDNDFFHDERVDNWSLGAILCVLLTGLAPFRDEGVKLITHKHRGEVVFEPATPSIASQRLVRTLLHPNPRKRRTIDQVFHSEWMTESDSVLMNNDLTMAQEGFKDF